MWKEINNQTELDHFINAMNHFHDCCIKEMRYLSGAYVDKELSMYPINSIRTLRVTFQQQSSLNSTIEVDFIKLNYLKLFPISEAYTCEILDASIMFKDNCIIWCDYGGLNESNIDNYNGTVISAERLRWRTIGGQGDCSTGDGSLS